MSITKFFFIFISMISTCAFIPSVKAQSLIGEWSGCEVDKDGIQFYSTKFNENGERVEILIVGTGKKCNELVGTAKIAQVNRWIYKQEKGRLELTLLSEKLFFFDKKIAENNKVSVFCSFENWLQVNDERCSVDIAQRKDFQDMGESRLQKSVLFKISGNKTLNLSDSPFDELVKTSSFKSH